MAKVIIKQVRSTIKSPANQKATMIALGLGKINWTVEHELNPQIQGMINRVHHLVTVTNQ
jgi:large subunit ribosomal protein L30